MMQQLRYAMHFQGHGEPAGEGMLRAATTSPSTRIDSTVGPNGLSSQFSPIDGDKSSFKSEVRMTGESTFTETGTISFGDGHSFQFSTVGEGNLGPSPEDGLNHGTIMWKIDSGEGQFAGASGYITSNFTLSGDGEVNDYHFGVIWVK